MIGSPVIGAIGPMVIVSILNHALSKSLSGVYHTIEVDFFVKYNGEIRSQISNAPNAQPLLWNGRFC